MQSRRPINAVFFRTEAGNEPVREWLKGLSKEDRINIGADIRTVQNIWPVGKPLVDHLGDQIWEVRSGLKDRIARTLFTIQHQEMILLHGFIKKERKTPHEDLALAKKRKTQYLQFHE